MQHKNIHTPIVETRHATSLRNTVIFIALFLISLGAYAQTQPISLTAKNTPIKEVFKEIQQKSDYRILYNDEVVADDLRVSVNAENVPVKNLLQTILANTGLTFVLQSDELIVITRTEFTAPANQLTGTVVDETGEPVPFANVVQLALPDSTFINGVSTAANGRFSMEHTTDKPVLVEITFLGYERYHAEISDNNNLGTIRLQPRSTQLGEVVVTANRPTHKMEADGLRTSVQNTLLSRLGTANDVLAQLPFVTGEDGSYTVFGRGAPLIYINNRLLRDNNELRQLNSADIKDVKVILTPGSQYDASVGSVIKITTVRPVGEGLSGTIYGYIRQRRNFDHYEYVNLNYRKDGLDIFSRISFDKTVTLQNQKDYTILHINKEYKTQEDFTLNFTTKQWNVSNGINYSFSPQHSIGVRYNYTKSPANTFILQGTTEHYIDAINDSTFYTYDQRASKSDNHYVNIYYHNEFKNTTSIHFEGDYVNGGRNDTQASEYKNEISGNKIIVENINTTDFSLYAGKLLLETPLLGGKITLGSEASYTDNTQDYKMLNEEIAKDLPSNNNTSKQMLVAGFLSYDRTWNKVSVNTGLRYEYIDFNYYYNNALSPEQSRTYNNFFPTASISYKTNSVNMSLGYQTIVRRPNYFNLRSSIAYNNPYTYEGGNPSLQPMYTHKLSYLFGYKDLQMEVSYNWIEDYLLFTAEQFPDKPITMFTMVNLPRSTRLDANISYSPKIRWWRPTLGLYFNKQNLQYGGRKYNKPYFSFTFNNIVQLPRDYLLTVNARIFGGQTTNQITKLSGRTEVKLNKRFFNNTLNITLAATDILRTDLERWSMNINNIYYDKWNDWDNRSVYLQATYTFNATRSKYKGQGAANEERNRL